MDIFVSELLPVFTVVASEILSIINHVIAMLLPIFAVSIGKAIGKIIAALVQVGRSIFPCL
jgi:hypothetical protein